RIPHAETMGDFVNTTTNQRYIKGNWTNFNPTDKVVNIGRFNATLSGSYVWSIPSTSIVNRPIFETRLLSYTPTMGGPITAGNGTLKGTYMVSRNRLRWWAGFTFGNSSSMGTGNVTFSTPFALAINTTGVDFGI